jgi:A/G-specific adenine glycosylase
VTGRPAVDRPLPGGIGPVLRDALLEWFARNGRDFPWRHTQDPYRVLVAELLLQRTRAEAVARVFPNFVDRFPNPASLAAAAPWEVATTVRVLGLTYRVHRLIAMAREIVGRGGVPSTFEELLDLPGVGVYVANAVLCFAFGVPRPLVDANVMRVLNRLSGIVSESRAWESLIPLLQPTTAGHLNYALIDLAAEVCVEPNPRCHVCPVQGLCPRYPLDKERWRFFRKVRQGGRWVLREQPVSRALRAGPREHRPSAGAA